MGFSSEHCKDLWARSQLLNTVTEVQMQSRVMTICKWAYLWLCSNYTLYLISQRARFDLQNILFQSLYTESKAIMISPLRFEHSSVPPMYILFDTVETVLYLINFDSIWEDYYKYCLYWKLWQSAYWLYSIPSHNYTVMYLIMSSNSL